MTISAFCLLLLLLFVLARIFETPSEDLVSRASSSLVALHLWLSSCIWLDSKLLQQGLDPWWI